MDNGRRSGDKHGTSEVEPTFARRNYVNRLRRFAIRNDRESTIPVTVEMPYVVPFID
jgi:hypothetical protein